MKNYSVEEAMFTYALLGMRGRKEGAGRRGRGRGERKGSSAKVDRGKKERKGKEWVKVEGEINKRVRCEGVRKGAK